MMLVMLSTVSKRTSTIGRRVLGVSGLIEARQPLLLVPPFGTTSCSLFSTKRRRRVDRSSSSSSIANNHANDAPFGLSKNSTFRLKKAIETSHQQFQEDWKRRVLASTEDHVVGFRKELRKMYSDNLRQESIKKAGLLTTAKHLLGGTALSERTEEEGLRERVDELVLAQSIYVYEILSKKLLYDFSPVYSHLLDEIFNRKLFQSSSDSKNKNNNNKEKTSNDDDERNYLLESGAITPQLAKALRAHSDDFAAAGIETSVEVRQEPSPPAVLGYASRIQQAVTDDPLAGLPKNLSLLHIPGGVVRLDHLPTEYQSAFLSANRKSVCVHVLIHTHETYTYRFAQQTSHRKKSATQLNMPRILTLIGHIDDVPTKPSRASLQKFRSEVDLAVEEEMVLDLFAYNPAKYKERYPNGSPLNVDLGITWQLADIDFLVARTEGWIEMGEGGSAVKVIDRFCFQPPEGLVEFDEKDKNSGIPFYLGTRNVGATAVFVLLQQFFLVMLLLMVFFLDELPRWAKAMMMDNGFTEEDIKRFEQMTLRNNALGVEMERQKGDEGNE